MVRECGRRYGRTRDRQRRHLWQEELEKLLQDVFICTYALTCVINETALSSLTSPFLMKLVNIDFISKLSTFSL